MIDRLPKTLVRMCLLAVVCALAACASEPERPERQLRKAEPSEPAVEVEEPSPEELAGSPCGNPDWAQLPDGAEGKAPDEAAPDDAQPAADEPAQQAPDDEQSNASDLAADAKPCA